MRRRGERRRSHRPRAGSTPGPVVRFALAVFVELVEVRERGCPRGIERRQPRASARRRRHAWRVGRREMTRRGFVCRRATRRERVVPLVVLSVFPRRLLPERVSPPALDGRHGVRRRRNPRRSLVEEHVRLLFPHLRERGASHAGVVHRVPLPLVVGALPRLDSPRVRVVVSTVHGPARVHDGGVQTIDGRSFGFLRVVTHSTSEGDDVRERDARVDFSAPMIEAFEVHHQHRGRLVHRQALRRGTQPTATFALVRVLTLQRFLGDEGVERFVHGTDAPSEFQRHVEKRIVRVAVPAASAARHSISKPPLKHALDDCGWHRARGVGGVEASTPDGRSAAVDETGSIHGVEGQSKEFVRVLLAVAHEVLREETKVIKHLVGRERRSAVVIVPSID